MVKSNIVPKAATCPACGHHVAVSFFDGRNQPLATLAWPNTRDEAKALKRLKLDFVRCVGCGHVYNIAFDYMDVPYSDNPNLMFNQGSIWSGFIESVLKTIHMHLPKHPVVVEVGYGDGSFLSSLYQAYPDGRYVGFDPHGARSDEVGIELRPELFDPTIHLEELRPDLVVSRHVLEHLVNPLGFLQQMSFSASLLGISPTAYIEVPCIDTAIKSRRTVDFYFEHSSQFTTESFTKMITLSTHEVLDIGHGYDGEVVFGFAKLGSDKAPIEYAKEASDFYICAENALETIGQTLEEMYAASTRVAIWGGTGKSAAFMCRYLVDAERFPLVVDSDPDKVGTFVPGTGQRIQYRDVLLEQDVDVVIIPPQWRAADIVEEMLRVGINAKTILIEHDGQLIDFLAGDHPYAKPGQ